MTDGVSRGEAMMSRDHMIDIVIVIMVGVHLIRCVLLEYNQGHSLHLRHWGL